MKINKIETSVFDEKEYNRVYFSSMLNKMYKMFHYENLPETIPERIFDKFLFENGNCFFTKHNEKFYVFVGGFGGIPNEYYEPTEYIVANPYLKLEKSFKIGIEGVLIRNDSSMLGILPILKKYSELQRHSEISLKMSVIFSRSPFLISGTDDKTKESSEFFIKKLFNGDFSVIGDNAFLESLKIHDIPNNNNVLNCIEVNQYIKASAYNAIGLDSVLNQKRERLNENEIAINSGALIPLCEDMLQCRKKAIEEINKMFNLEISVELSSTWRTQKETFDSVQVSHETKTEDETIEDETNVSHETIEDETNVSHETIENETNVSHETIEDEIEGRR